jgi:hypothetical protein
MRAHPSWLDPILMLGCCLAIADVTPPAAIAQTAPAGINLVVVRGEGVIHNSGQATTSDLIVKVEDDDHRPVSGASVVFALPTSGPSGTFWNQSLNVATVTDKEGLASARGLKVNQVPGTFQIYVTASYGSLRTNTFINQSIIGMPGAHGPNLRSKISRAKWKWIAVAALATGAAAGSIYYLNTRSSSRTSISVSAGTVQFGRPQ